MIEALLVVVVLYLVVVNYLQGVTLKIHQKHLDLLSERFETHRKSMLAHNRDRRN